MAFFVKAAPQQARLKVALYGPPGSGKTFTALLLAEGLAANDGKRIAYVDTERGTDFYATPVSSRDIHPDAWDFDAIYTRSIAEVTESLKALDPNVHGVIVLDSITHIWDAAIAAYEGKMTKIDTIPMQAWGKIKKPYKDLIRFLLDCPMHVLILGRQKNVFETDDSGEMKKTGVGMRAEGETEYEPHICARMEVRRPRKDGERCTYLAIFEKDRTGVLAGRTVAMPSFKTFEPLLPLLGNVQAQSEDPDEVSARDGELLDGSEKKAVAKQDKSAGMLAQFTASINAATTMEALATVAGEIKKAKRTLTSDHYAALGAIYTETQRRVSGALAPTEV